MGFSLASIGVAGMSVLLVIIEISVLHVVGNACSAAEFKRPCVPESIAGDQCDDRARGGGIRSTANRRRNVPFDNVIRRIECGIDPSPPRLATVHQRWKLNVKR